ncbi:MAG: hypothetical protein ACLQA5_06340 [Solirubrobacteraceae bacterium]
MWELTHDGQRGVSLFAFGLKPGRYGVWLVGPQGGATALGAVSVKHDEILKSYDLPADVRGRQIAVAAAPGAGTNGCARDDRAARHASVTGLS